MDIETTKRLLHQVKQVKQANDPLQAAMNASSAQFQDEAISDIARTGLFFTGLGAAFRGGGGLYNLIQRNLKPAKLPAEAIPVPIRSVKPKKEEEEKHAGFGDSYFGSPVTKKENLWFYGPGLAFATLGGLYGGYNVTDSILDRRRIQEKDEELTRQKRRFRKLLQDTYKPDTLDKQSEAEDQELSKIAKELDLLYDDIQKRATTLGDRIGGVLSNYGMLYGVPAALMGGYLGYKAGKKFQRGEILEKAVKRRAMQRSKEHPALLYAVNDEEEEDLV